MNRKVQGSLKETEAEFVRHIVQRCLALETVMALVEELGQPSARVLRCGTLCPALRRLIEIALPLCWADQRKMLGFI